MALACFYGAIAVAWIIFLICILKKPITFKHIMVAIAGMGYSLLYETALGEYAGLYHYINQSDSLFYIIVSGVFLYPVIEMLYTLFLPERIKPAIAYTVIWIILLLAFEILSLYTRTIVFTGWRIVPWSVVTYIFTFVWVNLLFRYLKKKRPMISDHCLHRLFPPYFFINMNIFSTFSDIILAGFTSIPLPLLPNTCSRHSKEDIPECRSPQELLFVPLPACPNT